MAPCPCGSGSDLDDCCGPLLGGRAATTALALMRSRYTAYVRGAIDYLIDTHDASTRATADRAAITERSRQTEWLGLEIIDTARGGAGDDEGIVEFAARGRIGGAPFTQRERSRFRRHAGRWYYVDGTRAHEPRRVTAAIGRNEVCPCGSGLKYKRCHGR